MKHVNFYFVLLPTLLAFLPAVGQAQTPPSTPHIWPQFPDVLDSGIGMSLTSGPYPIGAPLRPPLKLVTQQGHLKGVLAYAVRAWRNNDFVSEFNFLPVGGGGERFGKGVYFRGPDDSGIGNPQFSPDGEALLYSMGSVYDRQIVFFAWDFKTAIVQRVNRTAASLPYAPRSPDGRYIAYCSNFSDAPDPDGIAWKQPSPLHIFDRLANQETFRMYVHRTRRKEIVTTYTGKSWIAVKDAYPANPLGAIAQPIEPFTWSPRGRFLFTKQWMDTDVNPELPKGRDPLHNGSGDFVHPAIYEMNATGGPAQLIITDAYYPMPSPDGRRIAYFGWYPRRSLTHKPSPTTVIKSKKRSNSAAGSGTMRAKKLNDSLRPAIFVFDRLNKSRQFVRFLPNYYPLNPSNEPFISPALRPRWSPDGTTLYLAEIVHLASNARSAVTPILREPGSGFAIPREAAPDDLPQMTPQKPTTLSSVGDESARLMLTAVSFPSSHTLTTAKIDSLKRKAPVKFRGIGTYLAKTFTVREVSRDGRFLFVDVSEGVPHKEERRFGYPLRTDSLQAIDLHNGEASVVARFESDRTEVQTWTWFDESTPSPKTMAH
jgi:hypothetical protein